MVHLEQSRCVFGSPAQGPRGEPVRGDTVQKREDGTEDPAVRRQEGKIINR